MRITILGTGTSHGIPVVNCSCSVCRSPKQENKRSRCSAYIQEGNTGVLIDTATEFRLQAVNAGIEKLDAILFTHAHADHLHGLDDIRPFTAGGAIPVFALEKVCREIELRFPYIFNAPSQRAGSKPKVRLNPVAEAPFSIGPLPITPIPVLHGDLPILGFRIGDFAYITDCSSIPDSSLQLLKGLSHFVIGALRYKPHPTHFSINEALDVIKKISPERAYLTHICHEVEHFTLKEELSGLNVEPAFDGQVIDLTL